MNILIVDDDDAVARFIGSFVEKLGHCAEKASNGQEALTMFNENKFDLVLLDILLPDIKGYELIPEFKKLHPDVGVVTMTGYNSRDLERRVRRQGIMYYMIKPFEPESLKSVLNHISKKRFQHVTI